MKIFKGIIFILILSIGLVVAQGPDTLWTKTYGDSGQYWDIAFSVQQTQDGGYIVAGIADWNLYIYADIYLLKTDSRGDTLWTKKFGGDSIDMSYSVQQTLDGGYVVTGRTKSFGAGNDDVWLIKIDSSGDTIWTKTYGGIDSDGGRSVMQTIDGGYMIGGNTESYGAGSNDVWLIKTNSLGDTTWTKTYGGIDHDIGYSVQQTTDSGYIIAGETRSYGAGKGDARLVKVNSSGDTAWTKTYGGAEEDLFMSVQQTSEGGYIATGWTSSISADTPDVYLVKTDANGDTLWTRTYGGDGRDLGKSVHQTSDGGYIVAGWGGSSINVDAYLIKVNSRGGTMWTKTYGGLAHAVDVTADGGYIFAGCRNRGFGDDVWLVKTKPDTLGIEERQSLEVNDHCFKMYPNLLRKECTVRYTLSQRSRINLSLYDVTGRLIKEILNENQDAGSYNKMVNMTTLPLGVYFIYFDDGARVKAKKLVKVE